MMKFAISGAVALVVAVGLIVSFGGLPGDGDEAVAPGRQIETTAAIGPVAPPAPPEPMPAMPAASSRVAEAVPPSREAIEFSFAPVVKNAAPAVVNVYATETVQVRSPFAGDPFFERFFGGGRFGPPGQPRERTRSSLGSGVIVDQSGVVVTNRHVISNASEVKVALSDGREYQADILLRDERTDLAVLKIRDGDDMFPVLDFGDSDALQVGDLVLAIGNPFGVGQTVTSGIVSAVARTEVDINDSSFFIQTDAAINPGNSGGALVDMRGDVVGINTAIYSRSGGSIGIGFAIPSAMVRTIVAQAMAGSTTVARSWIGVMSQEITTDIAEGLGLAVPRGALVTRVDEDSPAARAGIRIGDVILKAGGRDVGNPQGLDFRLSVAGIGQEIDLDLWRDGEELTVAVATEAEPDIGRGSNVTLTGSGPLAGATVVDFSSAVADRLRLRGAGSGAVVIEVDPRSPAARTGLRPGDLIMRAQGEDIESAEQLEEIVAAEPMFWRLTINRGGRISNLVIGG